MSSGTALILLSLALFEAKHFICDFVLQTAYLFRNKGIYGHRAGFIHAGIHVAGSLPALLVLSNNASLILAILAVEFLVHYHVDWLKLWIDRRAHLSIDRTSYWIVFGADQLVHQLTYVTFLGLLAQAARL